ncbi:MAG: hypothetical protein GY842_08195, partial [bacterium]|nr:hypothetical protein [bacterium]
MPEPTLQQRSQLTPDQAIAVALNDLQATADGYRLRHPQHTATFGLQGIAFTPKQGGPVWKWRLAALTAGETPLVGAVVDAVMPVREGSSLLAYERGPVVERYLARGDSVEQQFIIAHPLPLNGADLVIAGTVQSEGLFEKTETGWRWRTPAGAVHLGDVRVFDAAGRELPATMQVTANATRIVVDGTALNGAAYPVTVDPEIGSNDVRLSDMGQGNPNYTARYPAVAYNSDDDEYLVVWGGDHNTDGLVDNEREIFGQRVDAVTGAEIGADIRLSDMGPD